MDSGGHGCRRSCHAAVFLYAAAAPQASPAAVTQKAQVPAPAYADSTLQATRYGLLQGAQEGDDFVWRGVPYGQTERWKTPENPSS